VNLRPLNVVFGKLSIDFINIILTEDCQQVKRLTRKHRQPRANILFHSHLCRTETERSILQKPNECHWAKAQWHSFKDFTYSFKELAEYCRVELGGDLCSRSLPQFLLLSA